MRRSRCCAPTPAAPSASSSLVSLPPLAPPSRLAPGPSPLLSALSPRLSPPRPPWPCCNRAGVRVLEREEAKGCEAGCGYRACQDRYSPLPARPSLQSLALALTLTLAPALTLHARTPTGRAVPPAPIPDAAARRARARRRGAPAANRRAAPSRRAARTRARARRRAARRVRAGVGGADGGVCCGRAADAPGGAVRALGRPRPHDQAARATRAPRAAGLAAGRRSSSAH